ncbi:hypothetical protein GCM10010145_25690 [Streptomyces ruber]|uniref:Uncharacterized protein n=2 Tax=Streptomyces TaxID=1883 RepID=A0A918EQC8_9ACTN|nr:hypothetical protein GCM10010145_25690 [Streptomyces ruber]
MPPIVGQTPVRGPGLPAAGTRVTVDGAAPAYHRAEITSVAASRPAYARTTLMTRRTAKARAQ